MEYTDTKPYFIEPGDDQSESLGEPLCIVRDRGETDRRSFARIKQVLAASRAVDEVEDSAKKG